MANRKDNKGRVLKSGESQRKDGTYEYKYIGLDGKRHSVYSKRLTPSDKYIDGKVDLSLREKIATIQKDLSDGIVPAITNKITFSDCYTGYLKTKQMLKQRTILNYQRIYKNCIHEYIGNRNISELKYSDLMEFYSTLMLSDGYSTGTLRMVQQIVHPVFEFAVRNEYIRKNPSDNILSLLKNHTELRTNKKHALTKTQQKNFLDYVDASGCYCHYYNLFIFLLGTGCRISEALGLRQLDCDFEHNTISINHNLGYYPDKSGKHAYHITTPKTQSSVRTIPMLDEVREALLSEMSIHASQSNRTEYTIDDYSGFIFTRKTGVPYTPPEIDKVIYRICDNYNAAELIIARRDHREPELLPHITSHILRHTFCTRYCEVETNLKVIQEIMGHSNIVTTMQIYNDATEDSKRASMDNFNNHINLHDS